MATLPNPLPALATDPSGRSAGLRLPPGKLVDTTIDGTWHEPLLWYADEPASPRAWADLLPARRTAGLHPLLVHGGHRKQWPEAWDLNPESVSYPGDHDAEDVLAGFWEYATEEDEWPGLAAAPATAEDEAGDREGEAADPDDEAAEIASLLTDEGSWMHGARVALVPARRSADIPAAIGWSGPVNHEEDVARLSAVLRSWEDRFGIRVVGLTFDQLVVSVAFPPTTQDEAEAVAAEHYAFCPDNINQGRHTSLSAYATHQVLDQPAWTFWWD
ncbi:DUF4253 domain-containing protein [Streptomyces sp. NPDC058653]|uniref:DUF4253 domain-containing protein n=1 Tax=Streptomyces sp. NPDC058653 TaxID=3346576 RepID=UPI00365F84DD